MRKVFPLFLIAGIFLLVAPTAAHADWLFFGTHFRVGHVGVSLGYGPPVPFYSSYYAPYPYYSPYYSVGYRPFYRPIYRVPYYRPYTHFYGRPIHRGRYFAPHLHRRY
ncbi:MAG TPA: hypothetical protein VGE98_17070 [Thermoanaerobaculia bacterium]